MSPGREETEFTVGLKTLRTFLISIGLFIYLAAYIAQYFLPDPNSTPPPQHILWIHTGAIFFNLTKFIGSILFGTGLLSLLLEISTIKNLVIKSISDTYNSLLAVVLDGKLPLDTYSENDLENLHRDIVIQKNKGIEIDTSYMRDSVYCLEQEICELIPMPSFSYFSTDITVTPDETTRLFHKRVVCNYEVINRFGLDENIIKLWISFLDDGLDLSLDDRANLVKINTLEIDDKNVKEKVKEMTKCYELYPKKGQSVYKYRTGFDYDLGPKEKYTVSIDYEYDLPIDDICHTFKFSKPCKRFMHTVQIDGSDAQNWEVSLHGYASFFTETHRLRKKFTVRELNRNFAKAQFDHWVLPGAGCTAIFRKLPSP